MFVIWCFFSFHNLDPLCNTLGSIIFIIINRLDCSPAALLIFGFICNFRQAVFDIRALMLVSDQNTIMRSCNHQIFSSHNNHRNPKYIDRMTVFGCAIPCHITNTVLTHLLCQCIPGSKIFPNVIIFDRNNIFPMLQHFIVKTFLWKLLIIGNHLIIIGSHTVFSNPLRCHRQLKAEYSTVPQCAIIYQLFCCRFVRFFTESLYMQQFRIALLWNNITIFGRWIGWYASEQTDCIPCLLYIIPKLFDPVKKFNGRVRIDRKKCDNIILFCTFF